MTKERERGRKCHKLGHFVTTFNAHLGALLGHNCCIMLFTSYSLIRILSEAVITML